MVHSKGFIAGVALTSVCRMEEAGAAFPAGKKSLQSLFAPKASVREHIAWTIQDRPFPQVNPALGHGLEGGMLYSPELSRY